MKPDKDAKRLWADHYLASLSGTSGHFRPMWEGLFFFINDLSRPCKQCMAVGRAAALLLLLLVPHINLVSPPPLPLYLPVANVLLYHHHRGAPSYRTTMLFANLITRDATFCLLGAAMSSVIA